MSDEETPPGPPRFPPVEEPPPPSDWPPQGQDSPPPYGYSGAPYGGQPGGHWLHPLDVGRAFSSSWRLFRLRWRPMIGAILAISVPVAVVTGLVQGFVVGPAMQEWTQQYLAAIRAGDLTGVPLPPASASLTYVLALVSGVLGMVANAAVIHIADANYRGGSATASEGLKVAFGRVMTLVGIFLALIGLFIAVALIGALAITLLVVVGAMIGDAGLIVLLTLIGVVGLIAAMVFFALRWSLAPQVAIVEGVGAMKSLGRSWRLINGSTWRLLGYFLLIGLIAIGFILVIGIIVGIVETIIFGPTFQIQGNEIVPVAINPLALVFSSVLSSLALALITPWWVTLLTLFYFDLRWRRGEPLPTGASAAPATA